MKSKYVRLGQCLIRLLSGRGNVRRVIDHRATVRLGLLSDRATVLSGCPQSVYCLSGLCLRVNVCRTSAFLLIHLFFFIKIFLYGLITHS